MDCNLLVLGGNGGVVNSLVPFFDADTIIAGRKIPAVTGSYEFVSGDFLEEPGLLIDKIQSVRTILNCIGYAGSDLGKYALNLTSLKSIVSLASHFKCRIIHLSTIKCDHSAFFEKSRQPSPIPYSPYAWSKLAAEQYLEMHWPDCSVLRMGFLNSRHCLQYYDHYRLLSAERVQIVTTDDLWQIIANERNESGFRVVKAASYRQSLVAFVRELTGKTFIFSAGTGLISKLFGLTSSKILDYCD